MIEPFLWLVLGVLSGWIGYLCTRTPRTSSSVPHMVTGVVTALLAGFATRNLGSIASSGDIAFNVNSLFLAIATSGLCVAVVGILSGTTRQH